MEPTNEERAAFELGFAEMLLAIKAGDIPAHNTIGKEMETLCSLANKPERVQTMQRGANLEIDQTVSTERSQAQIPACRFHGKMAALLKYAKACRDNGFTPVDEVKFG